MIHQAVILCAGRGTRLRPFTDSAPKPMLPILGTPMIDWNIGRFMQFGVNEFFINLHYLPEVLRNHLGDGDQWGVKIRYRYEPELLGTGGGVKSFEGDLEEEFFLIYGDIFSNVDYAAMEAKWRSLGGGAGMQRVRPAENYADADVAELDEAGRVIAVHPKPYAATYRNACRMAGVFILRRKLLSYLEADRYSEIGRDLLPAALQRNETFWGYLCNDYSKGIDTLEKWKEVENYLSSHGFKPPFSDTRSARESV